ncbi:MAG: ATPase [Sphingomonadales bacterium]|nr:ATPase [Sphingomonadales bacterium]MDE2169963.1 ATPase [Sphingomonadales bacterium]
MNIADMNPSRGVDYEPVPFGAMSDDAGLYPPVPAQSEGWREEEPVSQDAAASPNKRWLMPAAMILLATLWTAGFLWANRAMLGVDTAPSVILGMVAQWSGPAVLIGLVWSAMQMGGARSATRMGDAARTLRAETLALEERLIAMNRELSLAREFIAAQARDLDSLGRQSVERLSQHSERLSALVQDNAEKLDVIGTVGTAALSNMEQLRAQLPVIASATKDVTSNIGNAGRVAQAHLTDMVFGLNRLNEFGMASERQVETLRERVAAALEDLEARSGQLDQAIERQFEALEQRSQGFAMDLERHESDAHDALRRRATTLNEEIAGTQARLDSEEEQSLTSLRARLSGLRDEATTVARALRDAETTANNEWQASLARITAQLDEFDRISMRQNVDRLAEARALSEAGQNALIRFEALDTHLSAMGEANRSAMEEVTARMATMERGLKEADRGVASLTDSSVRLLELIQASARYSAQELPRALAESEERLSIYASRIDTLGQTMSSARGQGEALAEHVATAEARLAAATQALGDLHDGLDNRVDDHGKALASLRASLAVMAQDTVQLSAQARGELTAAIETLTVAARNAVAVIEEEGAQRVSALAARLGTDSAASIERAMRNQTAEIAGHLEQSAAHAAGLAKEAASQLRSQMSRVDELAGNLERRVSEARARAEEQVDNDFARRVALITETLNSSAIDIAKALDADVGETAWAAYLRGERGIFTRRAVKLLDNAEARSVLATYEGDAHFADEVNRYIHDFEALLRQLLSTRDGHALGVTLLSSDVGKLYVALAQAIERLRS